jgi:integrase
VLFGLYLGQRLGDLAKLTWRAVDLETGEVAFSTRKTGRRIVLPLVQPLADYLASIASERQSERFYFPSRGECEAHGFTLESVPGYSRCRRTC